MALRKSVGGGVGNSLYDTKQGKKDDRESGASIREVTE